MSKTLNDPELVDWVKPNFSTTTKKDVVVASICLMGALQKYYGYDVQVGCGLPSVTLLGEKEDWMKLLQRIEFIPRLGSKPTIFHSLLKPVLKNFVRSFDEPTGEEVLSFWGRIAKHVRNGSGPKYLSGWLTAFCFWGSKGELLWKNAHLPVETEQSFHAGTYAGCNLDGILYHRLDDKKIPLGFISVPVRVNESGLISKCTLVAGSVGVTAASSGEPMDTSVLVNLKPDREYWKLKEPQMMTEKGAVGFDCLQPVSGWWMYENLTPKESEIKMEERREHFEKLKGKF